MVISYNNAKTEVKRGRGDLAWHKGRGEERSISDREYHLWEEEFLCLYLFVELMCLSAWLFFTLPFGFNTNHL